MCWNWIIEYGGSLKYIFLKGILSRAFYALLLKEPFVVISPCLVNYNNPFPAMERIFLMSITYRQMNVHEAERILEIDNTIPIKRVWRKKDGVKQWIEVNWKQGRDFPEGNENHLAALKETFDGGGYVIGAFDNDLLVGFAAINRELFGNNYKYVLLDQMFISAGYRRMGIGKNMFLMLVEVAKEWGADKFYICAGSSEDTLAFYDSLGCVEAKEINQALYEQDENDVQLEYDLTALEEMADFFNARADSYDDHMLVNLGEFYEMIATCIDKPIERLLDLGCGTGLELKQLFEKYPDTEVTGIDMSAEMLKKLKEKFPDKKLRLICGSYFDVDFKGGAEGMYDCVLSTYSLHHFSQESKLVLYKKIYDCLKPGGTFVFGDYTVMTNEQQKMLLEENEVHRKKQGIADGKFYHFDTPFTAETEVKLMKSAGFMFAETVWQQEKASIIVAGK